MYQIKTLKNDLTLITVDMPHLESITTLVAVGAGSRYETSKNNGISHFLEHMFFKGSKKFPSAEKISTLVDSIGAVNNAATSKEFTFYWIKSAAQHVGLANDILSSMIKESLLDSAEIEREKGVIIEEIRMYRDIPQRYVFDLYERLQFGDQPLGWDTAGNEHNISAMTREDMTGFIDDLYAPKNMVLVMAGKLPPDPLKIAQKYYQELPLRSQQAYPPFKPQIQKQPRVSVYYKKTDQANIVLGVEGFDKHDQRRFAADLLGVILGEGMSSRLFLQVRERRGLAYSVGAGHDPYLDTGSFAAYAGLKLEKLDEGIQVIKDELEKTTNTKVSEEELNKAKEMVKGRLAIRSESTNFLAEFVGVNFVKDHKLLTPDEYINSIDPVSADEVQEIAQQLFVSSRYNLQVIGPFRSSERFTKILAS